MKKLAILTACVLALSACATQEKPQVEHHGHHHAAGHNHEQGHQMPEFMKDMTPEQRQQYRQNMHKAMEQMTPEQRKEFRESMHKNMHGNSGNHAHGDEKGEHNCQHDHNDEQAKKAVKKGKKSLKKAKKAKK
ncbi:MAG: DUF3106 domain-containing protein [Neisseriaceae bacterium]|nr:DUF3106 domain-containing protein [Neisseriaceae bacterium]MBQ9725325.1 DUF3106 domain-containing protein [Neisseriaceae bacterium]